MCIEHTAIALAGNAISPHDFDEDAICQRCGLDGAEWWHLNKQTPKHEREPMPQCRPL